MSLEKEKQYGDAYMMQIRGTMPLVLDPVLNSYVEGIGYRLIRQADQLHHPFNFFLIDNREINAFAFFGGYVGIHTGLFLHAETESEFASVIAHEIAHVTQRHLARSIEQQQRNTPATIAAIVGSILLSIAAPQAGMAGLSAAMAVGTQASINYTRLHEKEADRVGMRYLAGAGFDPYGMPDFFGRLAAQMRFVSKPPQMLLTHPLPESRISDSRNRAATQPRQTFAASEQFELAKARVMVRHSGLSAKDTVTQARHQLNNHQYRLRTAAEYQLALALSDSGEPKQAQAVLAPLLEQEPNNLFFLDTMTDIDLALGATKRATERLELQAANRPNNAVIAVNLANVYLVQKQFTKAAELLEQYRLQQPENMIVFDMLIQAYSSSGDKARMHQTKAEQLAMVGAFKRAIDELHSAFPLYLGNPIEQTRIEARIKQLKLEEARLANL